MSCKQKLGISLFLFIYFYTSLPCYSVSSAEWEDDFTASSGWERIKEDTDAQHGKWHFIEQVVRSSNLRKSKPPGLQKLLLGPAASTKDPLPYFSLPKLYGSGSSFASSSLSWTVGNVSLEPRSKDGDGYQADFADFLRVQGKVLGLPSDSSPYFSEWQAMKPLVECYDDFMTFTATGQEFTHLLVDRAVASPISVFQLPPYCGYSVRTSWSSLEMMVPYDACYITQENGSYVLPMLMSGSPLKLSCPMQMPSPTPLFSLSAPLVFCSPYGMAVQIHGQEQDLPVLGVVVNGAWSPFESEQCADRVDSQSQPFTFFISFGAPCITSADDLHLQFILDDQEYVLSCPLSPHFPYIPSTPSSPADPQFPFILDPISPASPPPPQPPTEQPNARLPDYPHYSYPGFQYAHLPQFLPPGPQPARPTPVSPDSPPGHQQQVLHPTWPDKLPYSLHYQPPVIIQATPAPNPTPMQDPYPHQVPKLPVGPPQFPFGLHYPYMHFLYPAVTPAPTTTTTTTAPPVTQPPKPPPSPYYPFYFLHLSYYPTEPVAQAPTPLPPSPPKHPESPHYHLSAFYPAVSYSSYYPYWPISYPELSASPPATAPPPSPTTSTATQSPSNPSGQFYFQRPFYYQPPTPLPPHKEEPARPTCPPYAHTFCSYYSYSYYPYYNTLYPPHHSPVYPPVPQYPGVQPPLTTHMPPTTPSPTPSTTSFTSPAWPAPQSPQLQCVTGRMVAFLPFAHPDSIEVRDQKQTWLSLSRVSPLCGYMLQMAKGSGVILHSPLPACHSQLRTPTTVSLPLRFWDLSTAHYRTLELQCPYQIPPEYPTTVTPPPSPTPLSATKGKINPSVVPKTKVFCSSHQMTVELPSGPISGIVVKDIKGNQMKLQEAPEHCGYSASKGKDGKIHLSFQLHSRCHMSVQGKMYIITVAYLTLKGRKEAQFSCPVLNPGSRQECNLPSDQRLPCGSGSVSQPQCLSMGCCFNKHPPACYYPMDECTIDRHFVFSVPAALTEPPLSPAMLVAASNSTCKPERVTSDYALFKIPMDGCGTRRVVVGKTVVYMVEVINKVQTISLNYGTITRDSPVRLLVECRFMPGALLTVSYVVKSPSLGPEIHTQGVFGVQLRISKDAHYSSYYPQYHQPMQMLLGKPLYLEVRLLNSPDPSLVLLVHYCVAYPRSGKAVWVLLYNGCPNPYDPAQLQAVVSNQQPTSPQSQTRRFTIRTFQFLPDVTTWKTLEVSQDDVVV
uniref:ZP domain-containing protein n=1 Tax=Amphiprion ocellaris TaxID=80972 RepID=A0A3Q1B6T2_AMPOC